METSNFESTQNDFNYNLAVIRENTIGNLMGLFIRIRNLSKIEDEDKRHDERLSIITTIATILLIISFMTLFYALYAKIMLLKIISGITIVFLILVLAFIGFIRVIDNMNSGY